LAMRREENRQDNAPEVFHPEDSQMIVELRAKVAELEKSFLRMKEEKELLSTRLHETHTLYRIAAMLNSTLDETKLYQIVQSMLTEVSFIDQFSLLYRGVDGLMEVSLFADKNPGREYQEMLDKERTLALSVLRESREWYEPDGYSQDGSFLALPLQSQKDTRRVLCFHATRTLEEREIDFLRLISNEVATAVDRVKMYHDTLEISIKDELTGIYNRRYFNERIQKEFHRSERYTRILSFIMIDIDYFKSFNDTYGHHVGDEVLKGVAAKIGEGLRTSDVLARYGGEEFVIILPETDKDGAVHVAEKIRSSIASERWRFRNTLRSEDQPEEYIEKQITISLGVSSYPVDSDHIQGLLEAADQYLYAAKLSGRNRVCAEREAPRE
jgi:diguanylate cyclase (GGDEF)-like protein